MKKVTVILSGIGISGFAGIALMEFFKKNHIKPNIIVGCSSGSVLAGLWAKGHSPEETLELMKEVFHTTKKNKMDFVTALFFFKSLKTDFIKSHALLKTHHVREMYHEIFGDQMIEDLPVETLFQTTDVDAGQAHMLKSGLLADAVYASSAVLPFYPPVKINNRWLCDGVFSESIPLKTVLEKDSDIIVTTDIDVSVSQHPSDFINFYAKFVQNAIKHSAAPRNALVYDMHNDEIVILPVRVTLEDDENSAEALDHVIETARNDIDKKTDHIMDVISLK